LGYERLLFEAAGEVATVTFNRPDVLNALDLETMEELADATRCVKTDPKLKVLILTGAGEKAFVAGADIRRMAGMTSREAQEFSRFGQRVLREMETLGKPSIAAVNGFALGGGCEVAMACSIRYAAETARFGQPEISLGIIPGYGGTQRLTRLVGLGRAVEICLTGGMVSAGEALRIGLVNKVVPADTLMDEARSLAEKLAANSASAMDLILKACNEGMEAGIEAGLELESVLFSLAFNNEDQKEGMAAFLEKRPPNFRDS
jgi:enoyl-CoA hydratase